LRCLDRLHVFLGACFRELRVIVVSLVVSWARVNIDPDYDRLRFSWMSRQHVCAPSARDWVL
jgi:hypothetical protein